MPELLSNLPRITSSFLLISASSLCTDARRFSTRDNSASAANLPASFSSFAALRLSHNIVISVFAGTRKNTTTRTHTMMSIRTPRGASIRAIRKSRFAGALNDCQFSNAKRPINTYQTGAPDRNRTCDPQLRKLVLYPTELQTRYAETAKRTAGHFTSPRPNGPKLPKLSHGRIP